MSRPLIEARDLSKRFLLRHTRSAHIKDRFLELLRARRTEPDEEFWALKNVSLTIAEGETVGLVGRNGSGKSTLLRIIAGILTPTAGQLLIARGARIATVIELGVGFHPELTGRENVYMSAAIYGLSEAETDAIYGRIVEFSGLSHFINVPLMNYSSGMQLRLGFSIAAHLEPDVLLIDEVFAVGDEDFQKQCAATIQRFAAQGKTIVFISHSAQSVQAICRRVCVLDAGQVVWDGLAQEGIDEYHRRVGAGAA